MIFQPSASPYLLCSEASGSWIIPQLIQTSPYPTVLIDCQEKIPAITDPQTTILQVKNREQLLSLFIDLPRILPKSKRTIIVSGIPALLRTIHSNPDYKFLNRRIYAFCLKVLSEVHKAHHTIIISYLENNMPVYPEPTEYYIRKPYYIIHGNDIKQFNP